MDAVLFTRCIGAVMLCVISHVIIDGQRVSDRV
jgi:hypothetical protein